MRLALAGAPCLAALGWWVLARPGRWVAALLAATLVLPPLPVALGSTGPHPALLFAGLGLVAGLLALRQWRLPQDSAGLALLALFLALLASVPLAALYSGPWIAAGSLARVLLFGISVYVYGWVAAGLAPPGAALRTARLLWIAAVASAIFACLDFHFQFPAPAGFGPQFVWLPGGIFRRAQGVFYEAGMLGNVCCFFLVMTAVAAAAGRRVRLVGRRWLAVGAVPLAGALVLSYSRSSIAGLAVSLAALLYLERGRLRLRRFLPGALASAGVAAMALYLVFPQFAALYWERLAGSAMYLFSSTNGVLSGRLESWGLLAGFLAEHPWHALLGVGYKTLPYSDFTGRPIVADNMYLSLLVETGVVGLAALIALHLAVLRTAWRAARNGGPQARFFGACIFCFWCGQIVQMLSVDLLTYWRVLPVYFWVLATAVRLCHDDPVS
jgi:O-antigen ligase